MFNRNVPQPSQVEYQKQMEMERQRQQVEQAKNELLARFPFYAISLQNNQPYSNEQDSSSMFFSDIPMPVDAPRPVEAPEPFHMLPPGTN